LNRSLGSLFYRPVLFKTFDELVFLAFLRLYSGIVKYCGLFLIFPDFTAVFSYNIYIQIDRRAKIGEK